MKQGLLIKTTKMEAIRERTDKFNYMKMYNLYVSQAVYRVEFTFEGFLSCS